LIVWALADEVVVLLVVRKMEEVHCTVPDLLEERSSVHEEEQEKG
jgi:hypothetical protein